MKIEQIHRPDRINHSSDAPTKSCFGTIFPDVTQIQFGKPAEGKVFRILIDTVGPGQRTRNLQIDETAWEGCRHCDEFQNCYNFSLAKLEMERILISL
jgi:hypothetical protein